MNKMITKCECGAIIVSTSKSQMKYNMKTHRDSKKHKRWMREGEFSKCQRCGKSPNSNECIYEHHKDENHENNNPSNKAYVCKECHSFIHSNKNKNREFLTHNPNDKIPTKKVDDGGRVK